MVDLSIPPVIPIFPLPGVVLLPSEILPLHIFEPRYRQMTVDVVKGHRVLGIVRLLQTPYENAFDELAPAISPVGCAGRVVHHIALPDGRFLIWVLGLEPFRISEEIPSRTKYRQAKIILRQEAIPFDSMSVVQLATELRRIIASILEASDGADVETFEKLSTLDFEQLIVVTAQLLSLDEMQRLALLRADGPVAQMRLIFDGLHGLPPELLRHLDDQGTVN